MACINCKDKTNGYCKVCQLLDGDNTVKKVYFCSMCNAHICEPCSENIERRWSAFLATKKAQAREVARGIKASVTKALPKKKTRLKK